MKRILPLPQGKILALALTWTMAGGYSSHSFAQAAQQDPASNGLDKEQIIFFAPDLTGRGRPGDRKGAASRGGCQTTTEPERLVALIPKSNIGLTVETHPTVWVSIPFSPAEFHSLEFVLNDSSGKTVYETLLNSTETLPGLASFTLPNTAESLAVDSTYDWYVTVYCQNPQAGDAESIFVRGSIARILPTVELTEDLMAATTERGKAVALARHGVWYDALAAVSSLQSEEVPQEDWQKLLVAIELEELASQEIVDCCRPSEPLVGAE